MVTVIKKESNKEAIEKRIRKLVKKPSKKGFNAAEFCRTLKPDEDVLEIQKRLRDEWR